MNILVVNDDGFYSEGLRALVQELKGEHKLTIVVPNLQQSGKSHSLTFLSPMRADYQEVPFLEHPAWIADGTPADCAKLALEYLMVDKPDLILSGINLGYNVSNDVIYSGTVSAAYEGFVRGFPTIALSSGAIKEEGCDYVEAAKTFGKLLPHLMEKGCYFYNINIPGLPGRELKGVMKTWVGERHFRENIICRVDPYGRNYFWNFCDTEDQEPLYGSDLWAISNNYVSITPLKPEYFDREVFNGMPDYSFLLDVLKGE